MALYLVFTTVASQADAQRLAQLALAEKLAACVQIDTVQSLYEWQGQLANEREWRLLCKTTAALHERLQQLLAQNHPYEVPAIYAVQAAAVAAPFARWVQESTAPQSA